MYPEHQNNNICINYLLTKEEQDTYDEMIDLDINTVLPKEIQIRLLEKYENKENDIEFIYYTGIGSNGNKLFILEEFNKIKYVKFFKKSGMK